MNVIFFNPWLKCKLLTDVLKIKLGLNILFHKFGIAIRN